MERLGGICSGMTSSYAIDASCSPCFSFQHNKSLPLRGEGAPKGRMRFILYKQAGEQLCDHRVLLSWAFDFACIRPGNSHSRGILLLHAIPYAPPTCFAHWARRLRCQSSTMLRLLKTARVRGVRPTLPGVRRRLCFRHRRRSPAHLAKYDASLTADGTGQSRTVDSK